MFREKKTLFYNGEKLVDAENYDNLIYDQEEKETLGKSLLCYQGWRSFLNGLSTIVRISRQSS